MTNHLTKPLPAFTRQQVLHAAPFDVNELLTEMTGMLDRLIGATSYVALTLAPGLSRALADRGQVEQVVMNLVVNARNAMPQGGSVTIETADVELENSPFHEEAVTQGHYVMVAITDSGSRMTKGSKETGHGTGPGLSATYDIVKQSNGYTWVYSEPGRGTTFKVYLPRADGEVPLPAVSPAIATPAKSASETVLLVDDDAGVRQFSKRILDNAVYRVFEAANGDAAERLFAQHADSIDLVVTDVIMPGCGGTELLGRLRLRAPAVRVLYMSGYPEAVAQRTGIDRGLPFVEKPFTVEGFARGVREALNR
jgi:two-component system cell cycle sensor histidine kinase/response regulator CckA